MSEATSSTAWTGRSSPHDDSEALLPAAAQRVKRGVWRGLLTVGGERDLAEEVPVALTYNGSTHVVMLASPCDLEDFALGFSLTEGIVNEPAEIESVEVVPTRGGVELRMWIARSQEQALRQRRRRLAGPTGCGLCGSESLADVLRPLRNVKSDLVVRASFISAELANLATCQHLHRRTRAVHAAAWCRPEQQMVVREDVGRHNALDKLAGALARTGAEAQQGLLLLSSRVSIEMVQKTAAIGIPVIVAISAPTALAVRACDHAGVTLIAVARQNGFEVFTHPHRINGS
jgi:FdhD protein